MTNSIRLLNVRSPLSQPSPLIFLYFHTPRAPSRYLVLAIESSFIVLKPQRLIAKICSAVKGIFGNNLESILSCPRKTFPGKYSLSSSW